MMMYPGAGFLAQYAALITAVAPPPVSEALFVDSTGGPRYVVESRSGPVYAVLSSGRPAYIVAHGHAITPVDPNVIPYNSLSTHPLASVVIDPSQFADTAAFSAWLTANFPLFATADNSTIDGSKLFNGGKTLKVPSKSKFYGYANLASAVDVLTCRTAFWVPDTYDNATLTNKDGIRFAELVDDWSEFSFDSQVNYVSYLEGITDDGAPGSPKPYPLSGLLGRWVFLTVEGTHADPANARVRFWVDSLCIEDVTFNSGSPVPKIGTIGAAMICALTLASNDPNKFVWLGKQEFTPGLATDLYSGLDATVTTFVADPVVNPNRVFPAEVLVQPSGTYQFNLLINNAVVAADSWATNATGGSIDANGLFTAGGTNGQFTVTATKSAVDYVAQCEVAAFDPKTDVAGLYRWCEVNELGLPDGTPITPLFADTSGGGNDLFNALPGNGAPVYKVNVQNGYAAAETDGIANVRFQGEVPSGAHTTFTAGKILPGGDHDDFCIPKQRWAEQVGSNNILRFQTGTSFSKRWQAIDTTGGGVNLGGDSTTWSLLTDRLVSSSVQELALNDGSVATMTPIAGMFDGPALVQDRLLAHTSSDVAKMQLLFEAHWTASMTDTEERKTRRWFNGRYRLY